MTYNKHSIKLLSNTIISLFDENIVLKNELSKLNLKLEEYMLDLDLKMKTNREEREKEKGKGKGKKKGAKNIEKDTKNTEKDTKNMEKDTKNMEKDTKMKKAIVTSSVSSVSPVSSVSSVSSTNIKLYLVTTKSHNSERNVELLKSQNIDFINIHSTKELNEINFINSMKSILSTEKSKRVIVLNGDHLINNKINVLFTELTNTIKTNSINYILFGCSNNISQKDFYNMKFDKKIYLELYQDVHKAGITSDERVRQHWKNYGYKEKRFSSVLFNSHSNRISGMSGLFIVQKYYKLLSDSKFKLFNEICDQMLKEKEYIWTCTPEICIPPVGGVNEKIKIQCASNNGWYYNFYV